MAEASLDAIYLVSFVRPANPLKRAQGLFNQPLYLADILKAYL